MSEKMRTLKREDLQKVSGGTVEEALEYAREISGKYEIEIDDDYNGLQELLHVCTDDEYRKIWDLTFDLGGSFCNKNE